MTRSSSGEIVRSMAALQEIVAWLRRTRAPASARAPNLLAEAGLLEGRRVTTHWESTDDFGRRYPAVKLDAERIFIRDGDVWTSAGISAGIDLALALIEDDLGPEVARRTAQQLVVHQRRISSRIPLMHWRATALAFAVSGHQFVHVAPTRLEGHALPIGSGLSRTNPRLDDIQKPAVALIGPEIC